MREGLRLSLFGLALVLSACDPGPVAEARIATELRSDDSIAFHLINCPDEEITSLTVVDTRADRIIGDGDDKIVWAIKAEGAGYLPETVVFGDLPSGSRLVSPIDRSIDLNDVPLGLAVDGRNIAQANMTFEIDTLKSGSYLTAKGYTSPQKFLKAGGC